MPNADLSQLLAEAGQGERNALDRALPLIYNELQRLAHHFLHQRRRGATFQTTAVVNEALLRMLGAETPWESRRHFLGIAGKAMRSVLVDHARERNASKRGGGRTPVLIDEALAVMAQRGVDVLALDDALRRLSDQDERKARLVELRFFAGLSMEDAARALGISIATAERDWKLARAWLARELRDAEDA
jgi:RNA polymerase sigma factor (TIGR02999 family)